MADALITIAGIPFPWPDVDTGLQTQTTMVDGGRNGNGVFIGQRIGRDQTKVELQWSVLDAVTWSSLLRLFEKSFVNPVTYFDAAAGRKITRQMYVGDRTQRPFRTDEEGNVLLWRECKLNLIDTGA